MTISDAMKSITASGGLVHWADVLNFPMLQTASQYRDQFHQIHDPRHPDDFNFVEAASRAKHSLSTYFGYVVDERNLRNHDPDILDAWIWGPHGEFTGFGKVNAFDKHLAGRGIHQNFGGDVLNLKFKECQHILFTCHPVICGSSYAPKTYVKFATYSDYVEWEYFALRDPDFRLLTENR